MHHPSGPRRRIRDRITFFRGLCSDALDFRGTNEPAVVKRARVWAVVPAVGNRLLVNCVT